ncbi:MAG: hypothetical protein FWC87_01070 [Acidimicrobiaceae bacterium]|nr:hypothetical protein [Acidimicrobiaceae bacterium]
MPTGYAQSTGPAIGSISAANAGAPAASNAIRARSVLDRYNLPLSAIVPEGATGAELILKAVPSGQGYEIERIDISVSYAGVAAYEGTARMFIGSPDQPSYEVDYSLHAAHDVGEYSPPICVPSGGIFSIVYYGLTAGNQVNARVQYSIVQYVSVSGLLA